MDVAQCLIKNKDKQGFQHIWWQLCPQLLLGFYVQKVCFPSSIQKPSSLLHLVLV